jgi:hypothetical protein
MPNLIKKPNQAHNSWPVTGKSLLKPKCRPGSVIFNNPRVRLTLPSPTACRLTPVLSKREEVKKEVKVKRLTI